MEPENGEQETGKTSKFNFELFKQYYPEDLGEIEKIDFDSCPSFIQHSYPDDMFFVVKHQNNIFPKTFIKVFFLENIFYIKLWDCSNDDTIQGIGSFSCYKSIVSNTENTEGYHKKGLARRRLFIMNALSKSFGSGPLCSGVFAESDAERVWKKLADDGYVECVHENLDNPISNEYRFLDHFPKSK